MWQLSAIILVVFGWGGLVIGKICRVELVGLSGEFGWLVDILELNFGDLVHMLEFLDVALEFRSVGQYRGQVFT